MAGILIWASVFVISFIVLIKSSELFTKSAERIGTRFGMSAFIVGVTIVSVGTSLPELASSIISVLKGSSEIVVGNVVGSNIANIFLVLGIAAIIGRKLIITHEIAHVDLPLLISSAFLLGITIWDGSFGVFDAILCLTGLTIYFAYTISTEERHESEEAKKEMKGEIKKTKLHFSVWATLIVSAFFIYLGAKYVVDSVVEISRMLDIGTSIIAASAIALGTSLPELAVSVSAARNNKPEIAIGNVLGSNIFNSFAVMGVPALFGTLIIPQQIISFALPMMIIATLLFFFMTQVKKVTAWEGSMLVLFYIVFIVKLFATNFLM